MRAAVNGVGNTLDWKPTSSSTGVGSFGTCCVEMDIWEANSISTAVTPHPCTVEGQTRCTGVTCANGAGQRDKGVCDKVCACAERGAIFLTFATQEACRLDTPTHPLFGYCRYAHQDGGDWNPYRLGDTTFFGPGSDFKVDTTQKITVVTQFYTDDNTPTGTLTQIKRKYVQNGVTIIEKNVTVDGQSFDSITNRYVNATKVEFKNPNTFATKVRAVLPLVARHRRGRRTLPQPHPVRHGHGPVQVGWALTPLVRGWCPQGGMAAMSAAMSRGMVLVMSIWDDKAAHMLWLDSDYPTDLPASQPGVARGTCATSTGVPSKTEAEYPNAYVQYSNIRWGDIGSTTQG